MAESFIIYKSFHEALKELTREQYGNVMYAINEYALNDIEPQDLSPIENAIFIMAKPQIDANKQRKENGKYGSLGGRPRKEPLEIRVLPIESINIEENPTGFTEETQRVTEKQENKNPMGFEKTQNENPNGNENVNANVNVNENVNENEVEVPAKPDTPTTKSKVQRFIKPTVSEIAEYCKERNNNIDAQYFYDHYQSKGWKVGKDSMKDWKAAVRKWEYTEKTQYSQQQPYSQNASYLPPGRMTL